MKMKGKETENRMKIRNLQVNHLTKPVGISGKNLRLSWNLEGGKKQNGFEVTVQDTEGNRWKQQSSKGIYLCNLSWNYESFYQWRRDNKSSVHAWNTAV